MKWTYAKTSTDLLRIENKTNEMKKKILKEKD